MSRRRVAVTGVGVVTSPGVGTEAFWEGLTKDPGKGPFAVEDWDPTVWIPRRQVRRLDLFSQYARAAAHEALAMAGDHGADPLRSGTCIGTGIGGMQSFEGLVEAVNHRERPRPSPVAIPMMMGNAAAADISITFGFLGPATTQTLACAAGAQAISDALRQIQWGYTDLMVAGGSEAAIRPATIAGFRVARALSPTDESRPFDIDRNGFVVGEGAAVMVLEEWDRARDRGADILAEILGAGTTSDAHHITAPHPEGDGARRALEGALADAGATPEQVGYINAHGTATQLNDAGEGRIIADIWGDRQPLVSSIKGTTGHALGASGGIEAVATVLAISRGQIPPNIGLREQDPDIPLHRIVTERQEWEPGLAVSNSFGFGGHNTVLVFGPGG
ncbi:MAG: beta-ketoacyl-[acyl-carrier-protein] synthase family protein [bacterium]|nr:beta-ketoacyl-[acyl-carrier-protein] synthase family protein [bacterium]